MGLRDRLLAGITRRFIAKPCDDCPFRASGGIPLRPGRAEGIAEALRDGQPFLCHKTTEEGEDGNREDTGTGRYCAGATVLLGRERRPNQVMQIAAQLGGRVPAEDPQGVLAKSLDDFVRQNGGVLGRRRVSRRDPAR
jgi:hypothetical protein